MRDRGDDILLLAEFFLNRYGSKYGKAGIRLQENAAQRLLHYSWPGNVRELQHCIERAVILCDSREIDESILALNSRQRNPDRIAIQTFDAMEKEMILASIEKEKGNLSAVAKNLGISRPTLYSKMKRYQIK